MHDHDTDPQDMRNMGGFKTKMPITSSTMTIATLAIAGVPLFSGFLSKDAILAGTLSYVQHHPEHWILALFGFGAAAITAFYMFRLIFMTFYGFSRTCLGISMNYLRIIWKVLGIPVNIIGISTKFPGIFLDIS